MQEKTLVEQSVAMYSPSLIDTKTQYFHLKLLVLFISIANMVKFVCN